MNFLKLGFLGLSLPLYNFKPTIFELGSFVEIIGSLGLLNL